MIVENNDKLFYSRGKTMKVNGIIAEYNPFHNGHFYQLKTSREQTGADYTIVVMSGNFTQRGEPAILSKFTRAEMALRCGADLVLELPAFFAAGSAEFFAAGAAALLDRLGVVDHLCFGSECGDAGKIMELAQVLAKEPKEYQELLRRKLTRGINFPAARASALQEYWQNLRPEDMEENTRSWKDMADILNAPNNILGLEYAKALLRRGSRIRLSTVRRKGSDYLTDKIEGEFSSALSLRQVLLKEEKGKTGNSRDLRTWEQITEIPEPEIQRQKSTASESLCAADNRLLNTQPLEILRSRMPEEAYLCLVRELKKVLPMQKNDFSGLMHYKLLLDEASGYEKYMDMTRELSDRIRNLLYQYRDFDSFCSALKTRDLTYTRISRCLLHILLNITGEQISRCQALDYAPYARILGFRKSASPLLSAIKANASIPMISRLADAEHILEKDALEMLTEDIRISHIYNSVSALKSKQPMRNEYSTPIVVIP